MAYTQVDRQIGNHWYFGNQYGINFSSMDPQADFSSAINTFESATTVSDKEGNLLFYTNGGGSVNGTVSGYIWNRDHEVMEGGELGFFAGGGHSAAQGAISILKPGTTDLYYLFTIDEFETMNFAGNPFPKGKGLSWFEIDMAANDGLGKVILSDEKLMCPAFEHLSITRHSNCEDYWLIARTGHGYLSNDVLVRDSFYCYKITESGIGDPIISPIPSGVFCANEEHDLIRFSPDGAHFICGAYLFEFNNTNGEIGNVINLQNTIGVNAPFPIAFSPDGKQIHAFTLFNEGQPDLPSLKFFGRQYNIETGAISFSSNIFFQQDDNPVSNLIGTPQLAPDGKLYIPLHHGISDEPTRIYVVDFPNKQGQEVEFKGPVYELSPDLNVPFLRFGNFPDHIFYYKEETTLDLDLPDQFLLDCEAVEPFWVSNPGNFDCMLWSNGETGDSIHLEEEGTYWLEVAMGCDIGRDSFEVVFENNLFSVDLGNDTSLCRGEELSLSVDFYPDAEYNWNDTMGGSYYYTSEEGLYWLEMRRGDCYDTDSIYLEIRELPIADIGDDTIVCVETEYILNAENPVNQTYEWQDGSDLPTMSVTELGFYSVTVSNECGVSEDQVFINLTNCKDCDISFPNAFTPNNDGISDVFGVVTDCAFLNFNLKIFNRWGKMVYNGFSDIDTWDGSINGKAASSDVYIYLLEYETINELGLSDRGTMQGDLTLLR